MRYQRAAGHCFAGRPYHNLSAKCSNGGSVTNNTAPGDGGGIYDDGTVDWTGGTISGNHPNNCGGPGFFIPSCTT
ncbi:MAG: hypothetical protein JOZ41_09565 [Chloroflexi bacterium]|nr:hypothetical protein [Chloroflexota bacterium]